MSATDDLTPDRVRDLVLKNRVIRSPGYDADRSGIRWGDDVIPALLGVSHVERAADGWNGYTRDPEGVTWRLGFDVHQGEETDEVLVVTEISGAEEVDDIEVPADETWVDRSNRYQSARSAAATDQPATVRAYIAELPSWQREVGTRIDDIMADEVPELQRAIKWHIPFYGVAGDGWFASFAAFAQRVQLSFLRGTSLDPVPPVGDDPDGRSLDIRESHTLDEAQVASWIRQAADEPGMWSN